jgi:hypothetical protein
MMLYTSPWSRFDLTTSVVIGTDCIGSCKSNYQIKWLLNTCIFLFNTVKHCYNISIRFNRILVL